MGLALKFIVLVAFAFNVALCEIDCPANSFRNDRWLIDRMSGWLYTIFTSQVFGNNEVFNCDVSINRRHVYCLTTNDNQCCRSFNISTVPVQPSFVPNSQYFKYLIETSPDCPQQLKEYAHMKLLKGRTGFDKSFCLILWTCRPSREGFHAFCTKPKVSDDQIAWIKQQFKNNQREPLAVTQEEDYSKGKCFPTSIATGRDNIFVKGA